MQLNFYNAADDIEKMADFIYIYQVLIFALCLLPLVLPHCKIMKD